ncbi:MAG TPA: putative baseplate assembly protein [Nitrospiraceae bacterium]|nr:putative baseplate assembly protein [Nitrospiraceae bacterium]
MTQLAPNLFQRRFSDLVEIGRARLPSLAPDWTDHNAHDPGITLMELLAWVAEAQLYSLSRLRRDERAAYAALIGLVPAGTQGATGLIWPDPLDPDAPVTTFAKTVVIPEDAVIHVMDAYQPTFSPVRKLLWVPGKIETLQTRRPGSITVDHTTMNQRGSVAFMPFGETAGRRDVLAMTFACRDEHGLLGTNRQNAKGALWTIGVLAAPLTKGPANESVEPAKLRLSSLQATLITDDERVPLRIESDSTQGLLTSGVLLLDLGNVTSSPRKFTIELRSANGFSRPPRMLRIEPNVIPIQQGRTIARELHEADGSPDWGFELEDKGLRFAPAEDPITLEVAEPTGVNTWRRDRLADANPNDNVYELDVAAARVTFGNGINGRIPPAGSPVLVSYAVSDAERGRVARNRKWKVAGFEGVFGVNLEPIGGGSSRAGWIDERREARRRSREDHALVSADDIAAAAMALPLLEVARAWVPQPPDPAPRTGVVTLIAMRSRPTGAEPEQAPETGRWLEAIRRRLASRMPLGTRLLVAAPRYVEFLIQAVLETYPGRNPETMKKDVEKELQKRFALVDSGMGIRPRQPGIPVTRRDIGAWLRTIDGVKRVVQLEVRRGDREAVDSIVIPRNGLPRWSLGQSTIQVNRPGTGNVT